MSSEDTVLMFAHRYKVAHMKRRKVLRKLAKEGKISIVETNDDGWLYRVPDHIATRKM